MPRKYQVYLQDILTSIDRIERYIADYDLDRFIGDQNTIDAVSMRLIIIGEAARNVPVDIQEKYAEVEWRSIIGLRNFITHEYFRLNLDRIWDIIQVALPELRQQITAILENEPDQSTD
jgi:uncharacterized protein with HEPN domain